MVGELESDADLLVVAVVPFVEGFAEDGNLALEAAQEANQHLLGGAFAGAARAQEAEDFALFDGEVDAAYGFGALWIGIDQVFDREHYCVPWPSFLDGVGEVVEPAAVLFRSG